MVQNIVDKILQENIDKNISDKVYTNGIHDVDNLKESEDDPEP